MPNKEKLRQAFRVWYGNALLIFILVVSGCATYGPIQENISPTLSYPIQTDKIDNESIAYYKAGDSAPNVYFLHGIPTSSYLWRNVVPIVAEKTSVAAFDLPNYGRSSLNARGDYSYESTYQTMATWLDLQEGPFVMVVNDLGSVLGIDYAMQNPDRVIGLVLVEAVFMPIDEWYSQTKTLHKIMLSALKYDWIANFMIMNKPRFQSMAFDMGVVRDISDEEKAKYLDVYDDVERRRVILHGPGPKSISNGANSKTPLANAFNRNAVALRETNIPILLLTAKPGFIVQAEAQTYAKKHFKNLTITDIGAGLHFLSEDQAKAIGNAINIWLAEKNLIKQLN